MDKTIKRNIIKYILFAVLYTTAYNLFSGSVIHTYFEYIGQTERTSFYSSLIQIVQCVAMAFCSLWGDKVKKTISFTGISVGIISLIGIPFVLSSCEVIGDNYTKYLFILVFSCIMSFGLGIYNVMSYRLPLEIFDIDGYGKYVSLSGIFSGISSFVFTFSISFFSEHFSYENVIRVFFLIGFILFLCSVAVCLSYKRVNEVKVYEKKRVNLLKMPDFTRLVIPNFLRGIATGILGLATVIGLKNEILNLKTSTYMATFTVLGALLGHYVYIVLIKKKNVSNVLLFCSIIMFIAIPSMVLFNNLYVFFIAYFIAWTLNTTYGIAIPVMVYNKVEEYAIGKYTAWRLLIFTFGSSLPGFFMNYFLENVGSLFVMSLCSLCFMLCGLGYIINLKNKKNKLTINIKEKRK